jgi:hypothetical protein
MYRVMKMNRRKLTDALVTTGMILLSLAAGGFMFTLWYLMITMAH